MSWGEAYFDHFAKHFGDAIDRTAFQNQSGVSLQVLAFDQVFPDSLVFASVGMSLFENRCGGIGELFIAIDSEWDTIPFLLANTLFSMADQRMPMGWGFALSLERLVPKFCALNRIAALYVTQPIGMPAGFGFVEHDGQRGRVLQGVFISDAELRYFDANGAVPLEQLFMAGSVDPTQLNRDSVV